MIIFYNSQVGRNIISNKIRIVLNKIIYLAECTYASDIFERWKNYSHDEI